MTLFSTQQIDRLAGFRRLNPGVDKDFAVVSTDSRSMPAEALFVALRGERFDAHGFLDQALGAGAGGLVVSRAPATLPDVPVWLVDDTLHALGELAHAHRSRFDIPLLGLTGSAGKTTTKEMLRAMLASRRALVTAGNLNNLVGVPLTLFNLEASHQAAVVEMGMNRFGEIARLTQIAAPTLGLITNIGEAHLAELGGIEGVLRAKTELAREMRPGAPIVLNADDPLLRRFGHGAQRPVVWFGLQVGATVYAKDVTEAGLDGQTFTLVTPAGEARVRMRLPGEHNLRNALGAAAAALEMGTGFDDIVCGLESVAPFSMRTEVVAGPNGSRIISDCYNANPTSMREAVRLLQSARSGGRIAVVLGDMLELGEFSERYHRELGELIAAVGPDRLWAVGRWAGVVAGAAGNVTASTADDPAAVVDDVRAWLSPGDTVLVKGSRGVRLDVVVNALTQERTED